jgi:ABC-type multidrug transport system fused ATPase/permease subunit
MKIFRNIKTMYQDIIYVSRITKTKNKKVRILLSVILSNVVAGLDIALILIFSTIITDQFQSDNFLNYFIEIFLNNTFFIPLIVVFRFVAIYVQNINLKLLETDIDRNLKVHLMGEVFDKSNYSVSDAYFYVNVLTGHLTFFYSNVTSFLMGLVQTLAYSYYLIESNPRTLIYFLGGIIILYYPLTFIIKKSRAFTDETYWKSHTIVQEIERIVENMFLIKILQKDQEEVNSFNMQLKEYNDLTVKHSIWNSLSGYLPTFLTMFVLGILVSFSTVVKNLTLDFIGVTLRLFQQIGSIAGSLNNLLNSQIHIKHFSNLEKNRVSVNRENHVSGSKDLGNDAVSVHEADFKYFNSEEYIFENLSFSIPKNIHTIITGPNGSGKSTILGLIAGVLLSEKGKIQTSSSKFGYIGATPFIFRDTIRNNLLFGNSSEVTDELLLEKLRIFETFKEESGYDLDRVIDNKSLSSGQFQKIAFIRALVSGVDILLLDESTSNLDENTKKLIFKILGEQNLTIINSTHDPESFTDAKFHIKIEIENEKRVVAINHI